MTGPGRASRVLVALDVAVHLGGVLLRFLAGPFHVAAFLVRRRRERDEASRTILARRGPAA